MRYTVISLGDMEFQVLSELKDEHLEACRAGRVTIVDMETQREMSEGEWNEMD